MLRTSYCGTGGLEVEAHYQEFSYNSIEYLYYLVSHLKGEGFVSTKTTNSYVYKYYY